MTQDIFAIETADGSCIAVGYDSYREAARDAAENTNGGRARRFASVWELRQFYHDDDWLDRYSDDELRYSDEELEDQ